MTRFPISSLFSAVGVAAAFDDAIAADAAHGRINAQFARLAVAEYGLPMLKADANPINKAAFLKLADSYRANKGKGHGIKGHKLMAAWGAAFDTMALGLRAGADPTAEQVGALVDAGQYLSPEAWAAMTAPTVKPKKAAAPKVGESSPVNTDSKSPAAREAAAPGPVTVSGAAVAAGEVLAVDAGAAAGVVADEAASRGAVVEIDLTAALDAVLLGLQTGAFTAEEVTLLAMAIHDASIPAAQPVESIGAAAVH